MNFININMLMSINNKNICIFGASKAGSALFSFLRRNNCSNIFVMDNDKNKHGVIEGDYVIGSFEDSLSRNCDCYLIGFIDNDLEKIISAIGFLNDKGINSERILVVDFAGHWLEELSVDYTISKLNMLKPIPNNHERINRIVFVGGLYDKSVFEKTMGGATGAMNMQRKILGETYRNIKIETLIIPQKWESSFLDLFNKYCYVFQIMKYIKKDVERKDAVYFANDVYSAYILSRLGCKYVFLYHGQGDLVCDSNAFGANLTLKEEEMITKLEIQAIENAYRSFFPSFGAGKFFLETIDADVKLKDYSPLYNCIYDYPTKKYKNKNEDTTLTFLSIGQMTRLKGIDRVPQFLQRIFEVSNRKIRWIVVANGELKEQVANEIRLINNSYDELIIEYDNIDKPISHEKIYELIYHCDVYIMLHRISIFDFSTLEAMYIGKPIVLSDIPGNDEFNIDNNIFLVNKKTTDEEIEKFLIDKDEYGIRNQKVYIDHFSESSFKNRYHNVFDNLISI